MKHSNIQWQLSCCSRIDSLFAVAQLNVILGNSFSNKCKCGKKCKLIFRIRIYIVEYTSETAVLDGTG